MNFQILAGLGVICIGTYLSTNQQGMCYQDEIIKLRKEKQDDLRILREETEERQKGEGERNNNNESKHNESKHKIYGKGRLFYTNAKRKTREAYVRNILESIFRTPFPSVRPDWLINPKTSRRLELDCYCEGMRVAFEIQGEQHYRYMPHWHKTYQRYLDMKDRDIMKKVMCKKRGICLIDVPCNVPDNELESYLLSEVHKKYIK